MHGAPPLDAFEQHRELGRSHDHRPVTDLWPDEAPLLQPLRKQAKTIAVPPQQLDPISFASAKDEQRAREGIPLKPALHSRRQAIEAAAHVGEATGQPDAGAQARSSRETRQPPFEHHQIHVAAHQEADAGELDLDLATRRGGPRCGRGRVGHHREPAQVCLRLGR